MSEVPATVVSQEISSPVQGLSAEDVAKTSQNPESTEIKTNEEPKLQDRFAPKFAALSRKEKAIREQEAAVKAEKAQIEKMRAEIEEQKKAFESERTGWKSKLKEKPFEALKDEGLTYEQLTEIALNDQNPTPEMQMRRMREEMKAEFQKELEAVKAQLADKEAKEKESEEKTAQEQYEAAVAQYRDQVKNVVDANDEFELIKTHDAYDLVVDVVKEYHANTGSILPALDAAKHVETYLEDEAKKILSAKKFQPKVQAAKPDSNEPKNKATLTNNNASELPVNGKKLLSREESIQEAAKLLRFNK